MANPLVIEIRVDSQAANTSISQLNKSFNGIGAAATSGAASATRGLQQVERSAAQAVISIKNQFASLGGVLQAAIGVSALEAAKAAVGVSASFQLAEVGIGAFVKEGENAKKVFEDLKRFSLESPLDFSSVLKASNQLLAMNTAAADLVPTLKSLSGAVFAITAGQNTPERLNDLIIALGQIKSAGALTGEEFRQLRNAGVVTLEELAKKFGVTAEQFRKAIVDRTIPAAEVIPAILEAVSDRFGKFNKDIEESAQVAFSNFRDALQQSADAALRDYLPKLVDGMNALSEAIRSLGGAVKDNRDAIVTVLELLARLGGAALAVSGATKAYSLLAGAVRLLGVAAAGALNPWLALPAAIAFFTPEIIKYYNRLKDELKNDDFLNQVFNGSSPMLEKNFQARLSNLANTGAKILREHLTGSFAPELDSVRRKFSLSDSGNAAKKEADRIAAAEKRAAELLESAQRKEVDGLARILVEYQQYYKELGFAAKANDMLRQAIELRLQTEGDKMLRSNAREALEALEKQNEMAAQAAADKFKLEQDYIRETNEIRQQADQERLDYEETAIAQTRDRQLRALEGVAAQTVQQKVALEAAKAGIEVEAIQKTVVLRQAAIQRDLDIELIAQSTAVEQEIALTRRKYDNLLEQEVAFQAARLRAAATAGFGVLSLQQEEALQARIGEIRQAAAKKFGDQAAAENEAAYARYLEREAALRGQANIRIEQLQKTADADVQAARESAANRSAQIVYQNNLKVFDGLKSSVGSLFDALVTRSKSFGQSLADAIKLPFLAAMKEIVSSRIAAMLFSVFGGGNVALQGNQPTFSGSAPNLRGGGNVLGQLLGLGGAGALGSGGLVLPGPGGTGGFTGPVSLGGGGNAGLLLGGGGNAAGLTGLAGLKSSGLGFLTQLGNIGRPVLGPGSTGGAYGGAGYGGATGGALLLGGGILAFDGLRRGGLVGLGETIAGGALIGAKFGGPVGALIGAGIGAVAGTIRLFIKGAEQKIIEKVKNFYGVSIPGSFARDPIMGIIKQQFGGNLDVGLRSQEIKDLIELYAMSTGQSTGGVTAGRLTPLSFGLSATGGLSQRPTFSNGQPLSLSSLVSGGGTSGSPVVNNYIVMDGEVVQAQSIQAIRNNPREVAGAAISSARQNAGRRELLAMQIQPGAI